MAQPRVVGRPAVANEAALNREPGYVPDPGDGGVIGPSTDATVRLVSTQGAGETRTLLDPRYEGQALDLFFETDGGEVVITADSAVNQTGNTILTFADGGDHLRLVGARDGSGGAAWRVFANDGVALS